MPARDLGVNGTALRALGVEVHAGQRHRRRGVAVLGVEERLLDDDRLVAQLGHDRLHRDHVAGDELALVADALLDRGHAAAAAAQERRRQAEPGEHVPARSSNLPT
jgi:hypothetical protein